MNITERAIGMLRWAIEHNRTLTETAKTFGVSDRYLRTVKQRRKDEGHAEFMRLYGLVKGQTKESEPIVEEGINTTDKQEEYLKFIEEEGGRGILDGKGSQHVKTLAQLIEEAKIDTKLWNIDRHVINKWDVTTGGGTRYQNWQVKVWLTKRREVEQAFDFENMFREMLSQHNPFKYQKIKYNKITSGNLLEINIYDLHLGKLCWHEEVNNNYDSKIAATRFNYVLNELIDRAKSTPFEKILFVIGNDFFNSDTTVSTTTGGTFQHDDVRWQKMFKLGIQLLVNGIDYMRQFAPVDVVVIPGNHDYTRSFFLGETLAAWYRNDSSVSVDNRANPRKYYEFGQVLLGLTHGNNEKHESLRALMAHEAKEAWARTTYKEFHIGHQHRKINERFVTSFKSNTMFEELGINVRTMSSLAGTDSWHHQMGYLGPTRAAEAFIWNKEAGLLGNLNVNIKLNDDGSKG